MYVLYRRGAIAKFKRSPPRDAHAMNGISLSNVSDTSSPPDSPLHGVTMDPEKNNQYTNKLYELGMEDPTIYAALGKAAKGSESPTSSEASTSESGANSPSISDQAKLTKNEFPSPSLDNTYESINPAFEIDVKGAEQGQSKV